MSDYTSWHVGMKVVCVDASRFGPDCPLTRGGIYTIANVAHDMRRDIFLVDVVEAKNPDDEWAVPCGWPPGFHIRRFRPVQKRKTDISIFTAMLNDKRAPIDVKLRKELV